MIKMYDLLLSEVSRIDNKLGQFWRHGHLEGSDLSEKCVNVTLMTDVCITCDDDRPWIMINKEGKKVLVNKEMFSEVVIC